MSRPFEETFTVLGGGDLFMEKQLASKLLGQNLERLGECIEHGWKMWEDHYNDRQHVLDARARAAIVNCETVAKAGEEFLDVPGVVFRKTRGTFWLYVGDEIVVRFKKLRRNGKSSNIMTKQQRQIYTQMVIPGFLPGTHLSAGYVLDQLQQGISQVLVAFQNAASVVWTIDLRDSGATPTEITIAPTPKPQPKPDRVRLRPEYTKKKEENE